MDLPRVLIHDIYSDTIAGNLPYYDLLYLVSIKFIAYIQDGVSDAVPTKQIYKQSYTWGETLSLLTWAIRAYYHRTIQATPGQAVFGREMIFNIPSFIYWRVITEAKQRKVDIDNVREKYNPVTHDYAIGNLVYAEMTDIFHKIDYSKQGQYVITKVFTDGTV